MTDFDWACKDCVHVIVTRLVYRSSYQADHDAYCSRLALAGGVAAVADGWRLDEGDEACDAPSKVVTCSVCGGEAWFASSVRKVTA